MMKLYDFVGSSSSFRVRIGLHWKNIGFDSVSVDLIAGEQFAPEYRQINPTSLVPCLIDGAIAVGESLAILEYLETVRPMPPLLPPDAAGRARVRSLALAMASGIQPLHTERTELRLAEVLGAFDERVLAWCRHWIGVGMDALERRLHDEAETGDFCHGAAPTVADAVLVPQVYAAARRFGLDVRKGRPRIAAIFGRCMERPAFRRAAPPGPSPEEWGRA